MTYDDVEILASEESVVIDGVKIKRLKPIPDERGTLTELLRCDDDVFERFGQCYSTTVVAGVVKAWHAHERQSDNVAVVRGMVKIVLYDTREGSPTRGELMELFVGVDNPILVHIPPLVYHGFKGVSAEEAVVINCPTEPYNPADPDELRLPPHGSDIPYDWSRKDG